MRYKPTPITLILLILITNTPAQWMREGANPQNTGYIKTQTTNQSLNETKIKWIYYTGEQITLTPITTNIKDQTHTIIAAGKTLHAINPQGKPTWTHKTNHTITSTPQATTTQIIFSTADNTIHIINHSGKTLKKIKINQKITNNPIITDLEKNNQQQIIYATVDGILHITDLNGKNIRTHQATGTTQSTPAITDLNNDGYLDIIYGSNDKALHVMLWRGPIISYRADANIKTNPTIHDKTITATTDDNKILKLKLSSTYSEQRFTDMKTLKLIWNHTLEYTPGSALTTENKTIIGAGPNLYIFDQNNNLQTRYSTNKQITAQPAGSDLDNDNKPEIIITTTEGETIILDDNNKAIWSNNLQKETTVSPIITDLDSDKRPEIITATKEGYVYVYGTTEPETIKETTTTTSTSTTSTTSTSTTSSTTTTTSTTTLPKNTTPPKAIITELKNETSTEKKQAPTGRIIGLPTEGTGLIMLMIFLAGYYIYKTRD